MIHVKAQLKDLEKKLDIVTDAVCKLVEQFQVSAGDKEQKEKQVFINHLVSTVIRSNNCVLWLQMVRYEKKF
ncbi:unnamed protein product [Microthlaspi erraticum]|uniref:Uncharacterized protein n=1 Tax=Microthlaspi erraticum TaxID=1685480 RepID=A0A6D2JPN6_9BRAS|nr:unnamed protein product [Microthlaspi erraticum]